MNNKILMSLLSIAIALTACKKEAVLSPDPVEVQYKLPQGNHAFDPEMVSFNQKYRAYFLYQFNNIDFAWKPNAATAPSSWNTIYGTEYVCEPADIIYVDKMLPFIKSNWLSLYPDVFLKTVLPYKVLFAKNLKRLLDNRFFGAITGYNHITIGNFSPEFDALTTVQKQQFRLDIHAEMWSNALNNGKLQIPADFLAVSNYENYVGSADKYKFGFLSAMNSGSESRFSNDLLDYIKAIVGNSKAQLDATILNPATDQNGLVKRKYTILINYYKSNYGLDLQAIGDAGLVL